MAVIRSIRTWLTLTLVAVSALTAAVIALYVVPTADRQFRSRAQDAALGVTARAAHDVAGAESRAGVGEALARASRDGQLSLWLVGQDDRVIAASALPSLDRRSLPDEVKAVEVALSGRRFVPTGNAVAAHVVALPTQTPQGTRAALVAYAPRTGFATRASNALRRELLLGSGLAALIAIGASAVVATLLTRRVRRLAHAASRIADGDFHFRVADHFPDEIGSLADSIDEMRESLAVAFAALERERGSLIAVLDRLEEGVVALDANGLVDVFNPAAGMLLGVDIQRGHPLTPTLTGLGRDEIPRLDSPGTTEIETPQGRFLRVQRAPLREGGGSHLVVVSDRTAEREREGAERRFVANASHELRTPLAAIVAAVEVLQGGAKDDPGARDAFLADLQREAERLQRLTEGLLTLARLGSGQLRPGVRAVELGPRLAHVAELMRALAQSAGISIATAGTGTALADPDILDQVLIGLVGNALKYSGSGSRIELAAYEHRGVRVISVADTGSGIPAAQVERVFDRFWRGDWAREAGGFGLGLGICKEYVEAMGGKISLRSVRSEGTTVEIALPAVV
jgi:signal transduction histidine kinase